MQLIVRSTFFFLFFLAISGAIFWFQLRLQPGDTQLLRDQLCEGKTVPSAPIFQMRKQVQKDIWMKKDKTRYCIKAENSILSLCPKRGKIEALEELDQMSGFIEAPNERHVFNAQTGSFPFPKGPFLIWNADVFSFREAVWSGAVIAPLISYDPIKNALHLQGNTLKRVLFWKDDLHLSAPEIQIFKDPITKSEIIQGIGDIHFSFDFEEQKSLETLLKSYL